jgi:hypothetical protein
MKPGIFKAWVIVKQKQLKFKLRKRCLVPNSHRGAFFRLCSRKVAASILNYGATSYQMWDEGEDRLFQGSKYDLAHWVLYNAGYECCIHDLQQLTGRELILKDESGVLTHILKRQ